MPWVRFGDTAATYPKLLLIAGLPGADARAVNEVRGWLYACATQSGNHMTDYVVDPGTAALFGGSRTKKLIDWCVKTGLLTPVKISGVDHWVIINDPEFIHIRTRAEVEWDRQRQSDTANVGLTVPVRLRDGDNCRYCGVLVQWMGRKSNRSAEYDHRNPGQAATVDTLVVACRTCNGARQANPQWDADHPLRPVPASPNYTEPTARFLTVNGYPIEPNVQPDALTASSADTAAEQARPAAQHQTREAVDEQADQVPEVPQELDAKSHTGSLGTGLSGTGRGGPGPGPSPTRRRSRGGRGRRRPPDPTLPEPPPPTPSQPERRLTAAELNERIRAETERRRASPDQPEETQ